LASPEQFAELLSRSDLPGGTPQTNAFSVLAHAPAIGAKALRLVLALMTETALDPVLRELVILRTVQRCDGQYAWVQHVAIAKSVGVNHGQIMALECGEAPVVLFTQRERTVFRLADEIVDTAFATDAALVAIQHEFSEREVVELLLLIVSIAGAGPCTSTRVAT
jgi:alkylhydroperoxidase family enzyme